MTTPLRDPLDLPTGLLAFAGDWHGNTRWAQNALKAFGEIGVSTVIHTGDFGIWPGAGGVTYLDALQAACEKEDITLLFVDGNHEDFTQLEVLPRDDRGVAFLRPRVVHLGRGTRWTWQGVQFGALGGAVSLDRPHRIPYRSWWPQEEITAEEASAMQEAGTLDVLITHDAPLGVQIPGLSNSWPPAELQRSYFHQRQLLEVVEVIRPALIIHGHFHVRYSDTLHLPSGDLVEVQGLDCDGTASSYNLVVTSLERLAQKVDALRAGSALSSDALVPVFEAHLLTS